MGEHAVLEPLDVRWRRLCGAIIAGVDVEVAASAAGIPRSVLVAVIARCNRHLARGRTTSRAAQLGGYYRLARHLADAAADERRRVAFYAPRS